MLAPERLILFDIDGTLLSAGGAPRRAFRRALVERFGTEGDAATMEFAGMTDPQILHALMGAEGFAEAEIEARVAEFFDHYLAELEAALGSETGHHLHPGVAELVPALAEDPRAVLGLVTGNVEAGARIKLSAFGLWDAFEVGAFGSDHRERDRLPAVAIDRAARLRGRRFEGPEVVVIGDTPADVRCARAAGATAVAVATGPYDAAALAACGADLVLDSLAEWPALLARLDLEAAAAPSSHP